jgi:hypothetical protein
LNFFSFPLAKDHHHACKTIQVHNLPPRWRLRVEAIANNIP